MIPVLDARALATPSEASSTLLADLRAACATSGCLCIAASALDETSRSGVLAAADALFALPEREKLEAHVARSAHHRGYSRLTSELDRREQLHLGPEPPGARDELASDGSSYSALVGPNLWPGVLGAAWRASVLAWSEHCVELGRRVLVLLARAFGLPESELLALLEPRPYTLTKLMRYEPGRPTRGEGSAMAPHCDFSLLTLVLRSGSGLQIRTPRGAWLDDPAPPGGVLVTFGELLEVATDGRLRATPHRVLTPRSVPRLSVPVFVNPDLGRTVAPLRARVASGCRLRESVLRDAEHVHRVLDPGEPKAPLSFGESEWRRKGEGTWCFRAECIRPSDSTQQDPRSPESPPA